jgi:hypothetical protein
MISWTLCCLSVPSGLPKQKLTLNQPLVPMNLRLLFHIYVTARHLEKCQQHEGLEVKNQHVEIPPSLQD